MRQAAPREGLQRRRGHVPQVPGGYPILYAFWDAEGRLDAAAMRAQVEHCIAAGAHGIAVLGLVTEVKRQTTEERRALVALVGEAIAGRVPYAVTIAEQDPDGQIAFADFAARHGADWVILQPPPARATRRPICSAISARSPTVPLPPVAIQNNTRQSRHLPVPRCPGGDGAPHPNIRLLKAEGWSVDIARVIEACGGTVDAFGGHGGIEYPALLRSGGAGLIPAPDCLVAQVAIHEALTSGDPSRIAAAEQLHRQLLPLIIFMTRDIGGLVCYGKRFMAKRLGFETVHDRPGGRTPVPFGLAEMEGLWRDVTAAEAMWLDKVRGTG